MKTPNYCTAKDCISIRHFYSSMSTGIPPSDCFSLEKGIPRRYATVGTISITLIGDLLTYPFLTPGPDIANTD